MHDMENFIKGIQECDLNGGLIGNCPYKGILAILKEQEQQIWELQEIEEYLTDKLKKQEAVKPEREHSGGGTTWWNVCGNCKTAINPNDKYCHECGQAVKWE